MMTYLHSLRQALNYDFNKLPIPINNDVREDVNIMCNLAEGIEERATKNATEKATKATSEKFIISMYKQGCSLSLIANVAGMSTDEVEAVIKKKPAMA